MATGDGKQPTFRTPHDAPPNYYVKVVTSQGEGGGVSERVRAPS